MACVKRMNMCHHHTSKTGVFTDETLNNKKIDHNKIFKQSLVFFRFVDILDLAIFLL